jgi:hypothetical protein
MTLAEIIRKGHIGNVAIATPATADTESLSRPGSLASLATVAAFTCPSNGEGGALQEGASEDIAVEPASATANPIYWEATDGTWHGPVKPEYLGRTGSGTRSSSGLSLHMTERCGGSGLINSGREMSSCVGIGNKILQHEFDDSLHHSRMSCCGEAVR